MPGPLRQEASGVAPASREISLSLRQLSWDIGSSDHGNKLPISLALGQLFWEVGSSENHAQLGNVMGGSAAMDLTVLSLSLSQSDEHARTFLRSLRRPPCSGLGVGNQHVVLVKRQGSPPVMLHHISVEAHPAASRDKHVEVPAFD